MVHRIKTTARQIDAIQDGPQPVAMMMYGVDYSVKDYIYFQLNDEATGRLIGLVVRKIIHIKCDRAEKEESCCTITVQ